MSSNDVWWRLQSSKDSQTAEFKTRRSSDLKEGLRLSFGRGWDMIHQTQSRRSFRAKHVANRHFGSTGEFRHPAAVVFVAITDVKIRNEMK